VLLRCFEEAKLIDRVTSSDGRPRYEVNYERPHHDHLICIECGTIQEIQLASNRKNRKKRVATWLFHKSFIVTKYLAGVNFAKRKPEPQLMGKKDKQKKRKVGTSKIRGGKGEKLPASSPLVGRRGGN